MLWLEDRLPWLRARLKAEEEGLWIVVGTQTTMDKGEYDVPEPLYLVEDTA